MHPRVYPAYAPARFRKCVRGLYAEFQSENMDKWELVQSIHCGASELLCRRQKKAYLHDSRGFGDALEAEGYPHIREWLAGVWSEKCEAECLELLRTGVSRGSLPIVLVIIIALQDSPERKRQIWNQLTQAERSRLKSLVGIAREQEEYRVYFKSLNGLST